MDSSNKVLEFDFVEECLAAGQTVRYLNFRGRSMLPMLRQEKDSVELSPLPEKLKKYDLPLYKYPNGKYVMHRVVAVKKDCYICLGDNTIWFEKVYPEQMIGVVTAFKRGEKRIEADAVSYRIYCRLWRLTHPFRTVWYKIKSILRKVVKPFRKGK